MGARLGTPDATAVFADSPVEGMITVTADSVFAPDGSILSPADSPEDRLAWARSHMPVTLDAASSLDLTGVRIGVALVLEPKTAVLALALADAGAEVFVFGHAEEVRPAVADALRQAGLTVFADPDPTWEEQLARDFLSCGLHLLLDDGSHLIRLAHEVEGALDHLIGAAEETTSGLRPLREWQQAGRLRIPVVASNDARTKTLFDNAYGTGQSCLMTILDLLDPGQRGWPLWDKQVVVAGYGDVGRGFAKLTAAFGGRVAVAELDPVRELQARMDGHHTGPLDALVTDADLVVSATGVRHTITASQLEQMRQDTVVAVIGGVEQEVAMTDAEAAGARWVSDDVMALRSGRAVRILDRGNCINVTAGEGNPIEIMDLSFGVQVAAIRHLLNHRGLPAGVPSPALVSACVDCPYGERVLRAVRKTRDIAAAGTLSCHHTFIVQRGKCSPVYRGASAVAYFVAVDVTVRSVRPCKKHSAVFCRCRKVCNGGRRALVSLFVFFCGVFASRNPDYGNRRHYSDFS